MNEKESYKLRQIYESIKDQISNAIEDEVDNINAVIYDIIQDRKNHLEGEILDDIEENSIMSFNRKDVNVIIKGHSEYEDINDMIEAIFCSNLKHTFGVD